MLPQAFKRALPAIVILVGWEVAANFLFDPRFIGKPSAILVYFWSEIQKPRIWIDTQVTFTEILIGYVIGIFTGGAAGFLGRFGAGSDSTSASGGGAAEPASFSVRSGTARHGTAGVTSGDGW